MFRRWFARTQAKEQTSTAVERCAECPLAVCATGCRAAVLRMGCDGSEARRLRTLGLFEGACVTVVEAQGGMLLEVCGSRLALGPDLARSITVLPLGS
jgi:Fe2+ transport system protein FeoA